MAIPLHGTGGAKVVRENNLHPTSRYRIWRLWGAMAKATGGAFGAGR